MEGWWILKKKQQLRNNVKLQMLVEIYINFKIIENNNFQVEFVWPIQTENAEIELRWESKFPIPDKSRYSVCGKTDTFLCS